MLTLLVEPQRLPEETTAALDSGAAVTIVGGEGAVSDAVACTA